MNQIMHIALQVKEKDIQSFYLDILNGEIIKEFYLNENDVFEIFSIKKNVKVILMNCEGILLELFVDEQESSPSFSHICLESDKAESIYETAVKKTYPGHIRKNDKGNTYFIKDFNNNLLEIKNNLKTIQE